jgi:hypothetical protein
MEALQTPEDRMFEIFRAAKLPDPVVTYTTVTTAYYSFHPAQICKIVICNGMEFKSETLSETNDTKCNHKAATLVIQYLQKNFGQLRTVESSNTKGQLQELMQCTQRPTPQYKTVATANGYVGTVVIDYDKCYSGSAYSSKLDAEKSAAYTALVFLTATIVPSLNTTQEIVLSKINTKVWVIVDLENIGDQASLAKLAALQVMTTGVASLYYNNIDMAKRYLQDVSICQSSMQEAADVYICFIIAQALSRDMGLSFIFILSKDRMFAAIPSVAAFAYKNAGVLPTIVPVVSVDSISTHLNQ